MLSEKDQRGLPEVLADHEMAVGRLYRAHSERLGEHREFWLRLAGEEVDHASWLHSLFPLIKEGTLGLVAGRFPTAAIRTSLDYVEKRIADASGGALTLVTAVSVATDLEDAMIEKRFFDVVDDDSPELRRVLARLAASTREHLERVKALRSSVASF